MNTRETFNVALLLLIAVSGCDNPRDFDLTPILAPVENRDTESNAFRKWKPSEEQRASLAITKAACEGKLAALLDHAKWSGHRMRVTGIRNGLPVTENLGPWNINVIPTPDQSIVEIKGLLFAKAFTVTLDVNRDVLTINDAIFKGRPLKGNSPIFQNAAFQGVVFERDSGLIMGSASILFLDDGRISMDFHKVFVNGSKASEYGVLESPAEKN